MSEVADEEHWLFAFTEKNELRMKAFNEGELKEPNKAGISIRDKTLLSKLTEPVPSNRPGDHW